MGISPQGPSSSSPSPSQACGLRALRDGTLGCPLLCEARGQIPSPVGGQLQEGGEVTFAAQPLLPAQCGVHGRRQCPHRLGNAGMDLCTPSCHHIPRAEGFPQVLAPSTLRGQKPVCGVCWLRAYNSCFQLLFKKGAQDGSKEPSPGIFRGPSGGGGDFPGAQAPVQVMYPAQVERNSAERRPSPRELTLP